MNRGGGPAIGHDNKPIESSDDRSRPSSFSASRRSQSILSNLALSHPPSLPASQSVVFSASSRRPSYVRISAHPQIWSRRHAGLSTAPGYSSFPCHFNVPGPFDPLLSNPDRTTADDTTQKHARGLLGKAHVQRRLRAPCVLVPHVSPPAKRTGRLQTHNSRILIRAHVLRQPKPNASPRGCPLSLHPRQINPPLAPPHQFSNPQALHEASQNASPPDQRLAPEPKLVRHHPPSQPFSERPSALAPGTRVSPKCRAGVARRRHIPKNFLLHGDLCAPQVSHTGGG